MPCGNLWEVADVGRRVSFMWHLVSGPGTPTGALHTPRGNLSAQRTLNRVSFYNRDSTNTPGPPGPQVSTIRPERKALSPSRVLTRA